MRSLRSSVRLIRSLPSTNFKELHRPAVENLKSRVSESVSAVSDTYFSVKDVFERHRVVFTVATSLASAGAAWIGYAARQHHQKKVEARLDTIEQVMTNVHNLEERQVKALTTPGVSYASCFATSATALVIGCGLGFRSGRWYTMRKVRQQQQKLLSPRRTMFTDLRKRLKFVNAEKNVGSFKASIK